MKNQKGRAYRQAGISTLTGIVIIVAVVIVAFGGVFGYQYFATKTADQPQAQSDQQNQNQQQATNNQTNNNQPSITVISPNGGETWTAGSTHEITWISTNLDSNTNVNIAFISGGTSVPIATVLNSGVYSWTLPFGNGATGLKISITSTLNTSVSDNSDGTFSVAGAKQTASWKTYTSTEYGFQIKYPEGYNIQEIPLNNPTGLSISLGQGRTEVQEINNSIINIDLPEDCMFNSKTLEEKNMLSFINTKEINGKTFYYYINHKTQAEYLGAYCGMTMGCSAIDVYRTLYNNKCYQIKYIRNTQNMEIPEVFNQILYTFKFTN